MKQSYNVDRTSEIVKLGLAVFATNYSRPPSVQLAQGRYIQNCIVMKRSRAKSRDDIMALMHVTYIGEDALPLQQDTEM